MVVLIASVSQCAHCFVVNVLLPHYFPITLEHVHLSILTTPAEYIFFLRDVPQDISPYLTVISHGKLSLSVAIAGRA